ncbi:phenylalanine--tRNA ligase subunit beta [Chloroflexota bacterium]
MRVPLKWLYDYVNPGVPPETLVERLTMAGLEVKRLERTGGEWEEVQVGQMVGIQPHPDADRLRLATVDLGQKQVTVVCGAPNLEIGQKVAFASPGARIIDPDTGQTFPLKAARIRGILSEGMVCSEKELGLSEDRAGIMVLSPEAPTGVPLEDYLGDVILDIEVTPNRPDWLSITGIAREVAALTGQAISIPPISYKVDRTAEEVSVSILDSTLCPRYCAALISGVKVEPSPPWIQRRLIQYGMRPINNIVDITNYVMLEYGQPLHAFDYAKLKGPKIIVRRADEGEKLTTLDGAEHTLDKETLVIADTERPVAIAGVMGGAESEVSPETTSILLESASFNSVNIRRTASRMNLRTEASLRFERGLSPGLTLPAAQRAAALLQELAGGQPAQDVVDIYPGQKEGQTIPFGVREARRILGLELSLERIRQVLVSLGFECPQGKAEDELLVGIPYWRSDVHLKADLAEEVARMVGYDHIPTVALSGEIPHQKPEPLLYLKERLKDLMVGCGFNEALTYSLMSRDALRKLAPESPEEGPPPLHLANPMSPEQEHLRTSLRAGLLSTLAANQRFERGGIRLFEVGKVYLPHHEGLPEERETLCAVLCGQRSSQGRWLEGDEPLDFFDLKAATERLLAGVGVEGEFESVSDATLHPASSAHLLIQGAPVGVLGEVNRRVASSFDVNGRAYLFELDLGRLLPFAFKERQFTPLPRFPGMVRDIAIEVDKQVPSRRVQDIFSGFPLVNRVTLFDLYTGAELAPSRKSLAFNILYQSPEHTLTEEEVNAIQEQILARLSQDLGARLRGSK